ncbi:hypothetical protein ACJX0J_026042 [Zea mays]
MLYLDVGNVWLAITWKHIVVNQTTLILIEVHKNIYNININYSLNSLYNNLKTCLFGIINVDLMMLQAHKLHHHWILLIQGVSPLSDSANMCLASLGSRTEISKHDNLVSNIHSLVDVPLFCFVQFWYSRIKIHRKRKNHHFGNLLSYGNSATTMDLMHYLEQ